MDPFAVKDSDIDFLRTCGSDKLVSRNIRCNVVPVSARVYMTSGDVEVRLVVAVGAAVLEWDAAHVGIAHERLTNGIDAVVWFTH